MSATMDPLYRIATIVLVLYAYKLRFESRIIHVVLKTPNYYRSIVLISAQACHYDPTCGGKNTKIEIPL